MRLLGKNLRNKMRAFSFRQSTILKSSLYLIFVAALMASCTIASNQTGPDRPVSIAEDVESIRRLAYPGDLSGFTAMSPANQANIRNQIVTARMYIADLEYHYYESRLTREMQDEGLLATAVSLGLTGSASLIPVAQTSRLLSGIATGVTGLDKAYNEKELLSNTVQALQTQMRADRKAWAAEIQAKMVKDDKTTPTPIVEYTLAMALSDADSYYQAGTIASALIGLSKTLANAESNAAQAKVDSGPNAPAVSRAKATADQIAKPAARAPRGARTQIGQNEFKGTHESGTTIDEVPGAEQILNPYIPKLHGRKFIAQLQEDLCVPPAERGTIGPATRALIAIFEDTRYARQPQRKDGTLSDAEITLIRGQPHCVAGGGRNYFEKDKYTADQNGTRAVSQLVDGLNKTQVGQDLPPGTSLDGARAKIREVRKDPTVRAKLTLRLPDELADQVTPDLVLALPR